MYIRSLKITNMRCFEQTDFELQYPGRPNGSQYYPNVNVLLGRNGSGKSTVLQAIALACLGPTIASSGFVPYYLVRLGEGVNEAKIIASLILDRQDQNTDKPSTDPVDSSIRITHDTGNYEEIKRPVGPPTLFSRQINNADGSEKSAAFILLGYGATRRVESGDVSFGSLRKSRRPRYQRVSSLFEDYVALRPLDWLAQKIQSREKVDEILHIINDLLPADTHLKGNISSQEELLFSQASFNLPFVALPDGYRSFIAWVGDLLYHLSEACLPGDSLPDMSGIVLVDEIDLHMHPEWQRVIIERVSKTFPKIQFVFTSHSPIIAGTLYKDSLLIMDYDEKRQASTVKRSPQQIYGLNTEQILLSSYFGLRTSRAPGFVDETRSLVEKARAGDQESALAYMKKLTTGIEG